MRTRLRPALATFLTSVLAVGSLTALDAAIAAAAPGYVQQPTAVGTGGAVASADLDASAAGIKVLKAGGNAIDAAVAVASTLGVTEPFVAGPGGGGYMVIYLASTGQVVTLDGRERCPQRCTPQLFLDRTGNPLPFEQARRSGLSVGVPGMVATWADAINRYGTKSFADDLQPAIDTATRGFRIDDQFVQQEQAALPDLQSFSSSRALFLRANGQPLRVGSLLRNPDLANTYRDLATRGPGYLYGGALGKEIAYTVQHPPVAQGQSEFPIRNGIMTASDVADYTVKRQAPTHALPRARRVRHGAVVVGRHHRRRGTQHPVALRPRAREPGPRAVPVLGGVAARVRRPQRLHRRRRVRAGAAGRAARPGIRPHPQLPDQEQRAHQPGRTGQPVPAVRRLRVDLRCGDAGQRGHQHQSPRRRRSLGQRGQLHEHHRAARRQRNHGSWKGIPAQQRDDRLRLRAGDARYLRPEPASARQASPLEHVADDRPEGRRVRLRAGLARRIDDHHDSAAGAREPCRLRHVTAGRDRGAARQPAQHHHEHGRTGLLQQPAAHPAREPLRRAVHRGDRPGVAAQQLDRQRDRHPAPGRRQLRRGRRTGAPARRQRLVVHPSG